jgi:serine/threonine-protein kinase
MSHPTQDQLQRLLAGEKTAEDARLEAHVNGCNECLARLESLQGARSGELGFLVELLVHPPAELAEPDKGNAEQDHAQAGLPSFPGYEILARVRSGGMGEVFKARHLHCNRIVALKTLSAACHPESPEYRDFLARFRIEAEAASRLCHPHVVAIYDVGEANGRPYLTMEWMDGGSLAEVLDSRPQPERQAATWVSVLARAVEHVHQAGILHRDLKPANILLQARATEDRGQRTERPSDPSSVLCPLSCVALAPKIADFGIARLLDRPGTTAADQWIGTPEYVAPELTGDRSERDQVGPTADVYSLGVLLYEMLTGRPPFRADEALETLRQVRNAEPLPPRRLRPRLSRDLETICLRCLQKEPYRRYPSAGALADDLDRWLDGRPIEARPIGWGTRSLKWARRHPERAALAALVVVLLLAALAGAFWQRWAGNAEHARQLAESAEHQFLLAKYAVGQTARDGDLRELLSQPVPDVRRLQQQLEKTKREFLHWFTRPGEEPPIINWFVMDATGLILADSYEDPRSVGKRYDFRDYYQGTLGREPALQRSAVYLSRVYESEQDARFKVTASTCVWDGDRLLGIVGASLAVDSRMVGLDMRREVDGAALAGPMDSNRRPGEASGSRPEFVVLLHRDYAVAGQRPLAITGRQASMLRRFTTDPALVEAADAFGPHGSFVHYARVGDSHFIVRVERPYAWPLNRLLERPLLYGPVGAALFLATVYLSRRLRSRLASS